MSLFDHNKHGMCDITKVQNIIFDEDLENYFKRKDYRPKGPFFELPLNELKLTQAQKRNLKRNRTFDRRRIGKERSVLQKCRVKLQKVMGRNLRNHFEKWGYFDVDRDGYLGLRDVQMRLLDMQVFTSKELGFLVDFFGRILWGFWVNFFRCEE
jgi:hypothetical protein